MCESISTLNTEQLSKKQQKIVSLLQHGEMRITSLADALEIKRNSVYHHTKPMVDLKILAYSSNIDGKGRPKSSVHLLII